MRQVENRLFELADHLGAQLGLDRRRFLRSSCGMAAAFMAMNSVFGPLFNVASAEAAAPEAAADRVKSLRDQLIIDVQTHFVYPDYPSRGILGLRELAKRWNPQLKGGTDSGENPFREFLFGSFSEQRHGPCGSKQRPC
ncbi:MAG: hypothetical protein AB7F20_14295 [Geoalkalibacter sp.]|jgi:hypothetical protein|uniref:hypothetical protein n=1 Tax=Geoalkalibacter sp. TaxID=3041440 RepID=UPI002A9C4A86|nr:hypothetical protein [Thermodesulfobacteriota bacterium]